MTMRMSGGDAEYCFACDRDIRCTESSELMLLSPAALRHLRPDEPATGSRRVWLGSDCARRLRKWAKAHHAVAVMLDKRDTPRPRWGLA